MPDALRLICARHAPVEVSGLCYGRTEVATTVDDATAAEQLRAAWIAPESAPVRLWASPRARCQRPARHLAAHLGCPWEVDPRLAEIDMGQWDGVPFAEIETRWPTAYRAWHDDWVTVAPPEGESLITFLGRISDWLEERRSHDLDVVHAVLAHAGVVRALWSLRDGTSATSTPPHLRQVWTRLLSTRVPFLTWIDLDLPCASGHTGDRR